MRIIEFKLNHDIEKSDFKDIKNSLYKLRGLEDVTINKSDGLVKVEYSSPLTEDKISQCLEHGGHKINFKKY